jgi:hypothetical protein
MIASGLPMNVAKILEDQFLQASWSLQPRNTDKLGLLGSRGVNARSISKAISRALEQRFAGLPSSLGYSSSREESSAKGNLSRNGGRGDENSSGLR